jgi:hypothetical protein
MGVPLQEHFAFIPMGVPIHEHFAFIPMGVPLQEHFAFIPMGVPIHEHFAFIPMGVPLQEHFALIPMGVPIHEHFALSRWEYLFMSILHYPDGRTSSGAFSYLELHLETGRTMTLKANILYFFPCICNVTYSVP